MEAFLQPLVNAAWSNMSATNSSPPSPPLSPPPPIVPAMDQVSNFFHQLAGAALAIMGVGVTVVGLHGMKMWDTGGRMMRCTKDARWYGALALWCFGQFLQLIAVKLAEEPVIAAVSNFAIIVNAALGVKLQGERVTRTDLAAMGAMIFGAILVVVSTPQPTTTTLSMDDLNHLFTSSSLPFVGLAATTVVAALALPRAVRSVQIPSQRHGPLGGVAFGALAGYSGATSVTAAKLCWLLFDYYLFGALTFVRPHPRHPRSHRIPTASHHLSASFPPVARRSPAAG